MPRNPDFPLTDAERLAARRREERRSVEEAGGGVSEGFEQAEEELIEHAGTGARGGTSRILQDARYEREDAHETHGEPDTEVIEDA
jgi:hypothetical protein